MPKKPVKVTLNKQSIGRTAKRTLSGKLDKRSKAYKDYRAKANLVADEARKLAKRRISTRKGSTGNYVRSIHVEEDSEGFLSVVSDAKNAQGRSISRDIEYPTGEYAGKGPILPKKGKVMVIPVKNLTSVKYRNQKFGKVAKRKSTKSKSTNPIDQSVIFVKQVKGSKGLHIMRDAAANIARKYGYKFNKVR